MSRITLAQFVKQKPFLFCADSDGCAMDTMTSKHELAFCPRLIDTYHLHAHENLVTTEWLRLNLYSATRGINRFQGLAYIIRFLSAQGVELSGATDYLHWVDSAPLLSNDTLRAAHAAGGGEGLRQALAWSIAVNETVAAMGPPSLPFEGCREALAAAHAQADTAVVSAANRAAVFAEWERCALACHMELLMGQEDGSKAHCLKTLSAKGYAPEHVLMAGDALGDLDAAEQAGALFFPILVGQERESWARLLAEGLPRFWNGTFAGTYQETLLRAQRALLH